MAAVCDPLGVSWATRDLATADEATGPGGRESVPVVLVDGEVHDIFRVDPDRLGVAS